MAKASKPLTRTRRRQRGAAAVLGAVTAILGLIAVGLAVDLARLYAAQRSLQRIANVAALDASRIAGGCFGVAARGPNPLVSARDEARASLIRNGGNPSWIEGRGLVRLGQMRVDAAGVRQFDALFDDDGLPLGALAAHDSVQVVLLRPTPPRLIPAFSSGDGPREMVAVASAMSRPIARFGVGSGLLGVDLSDSILDPLLVRLLGASPGISAVDYRNLLGVGLTVDGLSAALEQGELGELLLEVLPASDLLTAVAELVETVTADLGPGIAGLDELLGLTPDVAGVAGDLTVSVGQLVGQALLQVAAGSPISISCPTGLEPLLNCSGGVIQVLDPGTPGAQGVPDMGGGDDVGFASSGQVQVSLPNVGINLPGILSGDVSVALGAATGEARVSNIQCPRAGQPDPVVELLAETQLLDGNINADLALDLDLASTVGELEGIIGPLGGLLGTLVGGLLNVEVSATVSLDAPLTFGSGGGPTTLAFVLDENHDRLTGMPSQQYPQGTDLAVVTAVQSALANASVSVKNVSAKVTLLGGLGGLGTVNLQPNQAVALVNALLGTGSDLALSDEFSGLTDLLEATLGPLINNALNSLGVQVAYADYRVFDVTDGQPVLFER